MPDLAQSRDALAHGNAIRLARARLKRGLYARQVTLSEALSASCARTAMIEPILASQRGWGPTRTARFLERVGISGGRECGMLTARQRALVCTVAAQRSRWSVDPFEDAA